MCLSILKSRGGKEVDGGGNMGGVTSYQKKIEEKTYSTF